MSRRPGIPFRAVGLFALVALVGGVQQQHARAAGDASAAPRASAPPSPTKPASATAIRKVNWKKRMKSDDGDASVSFDSVTYADLDGDGQEEAIVISTYQYPTREGQGTDLFTTRKGKVVSFPMPDNPEILGNAEIASRLASAQGDHFVVTYTFGEAICCPDRELTATFVWRDGHWVEDRAARKVKRLPQ